MRTEKVVITPDLNKAVWERGIRAKNPRIRVRITRRRSEKGDNNGDFYSEVDHVPVDCYKGLQTEPVEVEI